MSTTNRGVKTYLGSLQGDCILRVDQAGKMLVTVGAIEIEYLSAIKELLVKNY